MTTCGTYPVKNIQALNFKAETVSCPGLEVSLMKLTGLWTMTDGSIEMSGAWVVKTGFLLECQNHFTIYRQTAW